MPTAKTAQIIRGGKTQTFDPRKHPRSQRGRFINTADPIKTSVSRRDILQSLSNEQRQRLQQVLESRQKPQVSKAELRRQSGVLRDTQKAAQAYQARLEIYLALNHEQRRRLQQVLEKLKDERSQPSDKLLAANPDHLSIKNNKLAIWDGKTELSSYKGGFKTRKVRDFEYSVEVDGKQVIINRNTNMHEFMGERIYGMPSLSPRLAAMTPTQLADGLARYMTKVETKDSTVPDWLPTYHGKVDKGLLKNGYGKMQQHHIHQWAKVPLDSIVKDYEAGKITLDEAKSQTKAILSRETLKTKSGKEKEDWVLEPADRDKRSFVVLSGGLHDFTNKPLYWANHPMGVDVDAPDYRLRPYRLPKTGKSGRDWHSNVFRPESWIEIYRRESYVLLGELNRRVAKKEITAQEAQKLFREGLEKVDRANQFKLKYKNSQGS